MTIQGGDWRITHKLSSPIIHNDSQNLKNHTDALSAVTWDTTLLHRKQNTGVLQLAAITASPTVRNNVLNLYLEGCNGLSLGRYLGGQE